MKNIFFEWVEPHLVRDRNLRLMEFVMNVIWIKAR